MSLADALFGRQPLRIGPGRLVSIVGPSGAGKDTLIAGACEALGGDTQFVFPRRVVTRPSTAFEDHDSLDDDGFERASADGAFAFAWGAHGLKYGIPISIADDIRSGRTVVCNVSRTVIKALYARYEHPTVVLVTAPTDVISMRLAARGRASDADLAGRINRTQALSGLFRADFTISNDGPPEAGIQRLVQIISGARGLQNFGAEMLF